MRQRTIKNLDEKLELNSSFLIKDPRECKGCWNKVFGNDNPIFLEVGCGKGQFIFKHATSCPEKNFIAVEGQSSVALRVLEKAEENQQQNLRIFIDFVNDLHDYFEEGELAGLYLNFSDPWPKAGHAKRRLTHRDFLAIYSRLLKKDGILRFKTDNADLFDFSLEEFEAFGAEILWQTRDLHNSEKNADNVMTEYEKNFSQKGFSICSAWVKLPKSEEKTMLRDLVTKSRSKRSFAPNVKIPHSILEELCDVARLCPAAMNLQPLKYRLVEESEEIAAMLSVTRWATSLDQKLPPDGHEPTAFIVICHDTAIVEQKPIFSIDVGIAAQTIMLAACERGFGGCIIGSGDNERIRDILSIPAHLCPVLVLGLGKPDEKVVLATAKGENVKYYRDKSNIHYVPKRPLKDIIIK